MSRAERDQPHRLLREGRAREGSRPRKVRPCCGWSLRHSRAPGRRDRAGRGCVPRRAGSAAAAAPGRTPKGKFTARQGGVVLRLVAATQPRSVGRERAERGCVPRRAGSAAAAAPGRTPKGKFTAQQGGVVLRLVAATQPRSGGGGRRRPRSPATKLTDRKVTQRNGRRGIGGLRRGRIRRRRIRRRRRTFASHQQGQECGERKEFFHSVNNCGFWR